ncbi:MAG: hypothetical protein ACRDOA_01370 [Streptosporangiaceae bacterium]
MIQLPSSALDQLLTPCLVVDVPAASRNIRRCADILIANQVVDAAALDEVAEAAALARLTVVVDHELQVGLLARAATRRGVPIGALVELDVGAVGDKVLLIPAHVDPAVNLYDRLFAWSGTEFTEWEVDGRRRYRLPGPVSR